jgi:hypothetical protein
MAILPKDLLGPELRFRAFFCFFGMVWWFLAGGRRESVDYCAPHKIGSFWRVLEGGMARAKPAQP